MGVRSAALVAAAAAAPAGNMVVLKQVCFHPKADGGACAVGATIHGAQDVASQLCGELTTCHTPAAFATCPDPSVPRFLESAVTGACAAASAGAYPAAGAARRGRAAATLLRPVLDRPAVLALPREPRRAGAIFFSDCFR